MSLEQYRRKRDFSRTTEPGGAASPPDPAERRFVVQRHRASRLHYDFRLQIDGVLVSWAVPKGPSLDPGLKRGAFRVEDHPIGYYDFEGTIPAGEYGGGDVIVWDCGEFEPELTDDPGRALRDGELKLVLRGEKLRGRFTIVRTRGLGGGRAGASDRESWLLIKKRDEWAVPGWDAESYPKSVKTGRTNDEVAAGLPVKLAAEGPQASGPTAAARTVAGTAITAMPSFIEPMTATLADGPFNDPDWLFEVKWDGYRVQAHVRDGRVALFTRRGLDAADCFPELAGPPTWIDAREVILDGEVVALNADGRPDFGLLQARKRVMARRASGSTASSSTLAYVIFDLLYLDGHLLVDRPLDERKTLLRSVLHDSGFVQYATHIEGDGEAFYDAVAEQGLEGVMAKLRRSRYEPGRRSPAWLKIKRRSEQEVVIGGWTPREGTQDDLGALMVGVFEGDELRPAGKVGTGFDAGERRRLMELMVPLARAKSAFQPIPREKGARWIDPKLVARVEFAEWTPDGSLRAPSYKGLDPDADPRAVERERPRNTAAARKVAVEAVASEAPTQAVESAADRAEDRPGKPRVASSQADRVSPAEIEALEGLPGKGGLWSVGGRQLKLSNLDKVLWPADDITKRDLIRYYVSIAPYLLPYLRGRALTLQRYPDGIERTGFWQKQVPGHAPEWVECWPWTSAQSGSTEYLLADSVATLAWVANEAAIDIHPSTFDIAAPDRPTWALVDIDPGQRTEWSDLLLLGRLYGTALDHLGLRGFAKLTGQRGIQVWIPIKPIYGFDETRDWVAALSRTIAAATPNLVSWEWVKSRRDGLARLDYTQNAWNKTLVAPYSVRPVKGAAVSAPIAWDELDDPDLRPDRWTLRTILDRLAVRGDLFAAAVGLEQELPPL